MGGPHNKEYSILGVYIGVPYLGKLPCEQVRTFGQGVLATEAMTAFSIFCALSEGKVNNPGKATALSVAGSKETRRFPDECIDLVGKT